MEDNSNLIKCREAGKIFGLQGKYKPLNIFIGSALFVAPNYGDYEKNKINKFIEVLLQSQRKIDIDFSNCTIKEMNMFIFEYLNITSIN